MAELPPLVLRLVERQRAELLPLLATRPSCCTWSSCRRSVSALPHLVGRWAWPARARWWHQAELLQAVELLAGGHQVAELLPLVLHQVLRLGRC